MNNKHLRIVSLTAGIAGAAILITACGTTRGYKQADKTGEGIAEYRDEIVKGKMAIDATMKSLGDIATSADTDPRKPFEQYSKDVANLESTAQKIRKRGESMRQQGQAYFEQWEKQLASVSNPEIRALAEQRKTTLQKTFASIKMHADPLKSQFDPWMSDLKDLQKYLSQDLTVGGVDAAKPLFTKTTEGGRAVQKSMDELVADLNTVAATITAAKASPPPPGTAPAQPAQAEKK